MTKADEAERKAFFERLRQAFQRWEKRGAGNTKEELSRRTGAASGTVNAWLNPKGGAPSLPSADYLVKLPGALGVSGDWLLTGTGSPEPVPESQAQATLRIIGMIVEAATSAEPSGEEWATGLARTLQQATAALSRPLLHEGPGEDREAGG